MRDNERGAGTVDKIGSQYRAFGTMTVYSPVDKIGSQYRAFGTMTVYSPVDKIGSNLRE